MPVVRRADARHRPRGPRRLAVPRVCPALYDERPVVAVRELPQAAADPAVADLAAIQAAREVWILASGAEKADAVAEAVSGVSQDKLPAAGARGRDRTLFLIDEAAAGQLPPPA